VSTNSQFAVMLRCSCACSRHYTSRLRGAKDLYQRAAGVGFKTEGRQALTRRVLQQRGATGSEEDLVNLGLQQCV